MPKIVDFSNHLKVDGNAYAKDSLNYEINENVLLLYHERTPQDRSVIHAEYWEWTNTDDVAYASMDALIADLDIFLFAVPLLGQDEISRGLVDGVSQWNKFGYREGLTAAAGEETVWATTGNFTVFTTASTFTITYNNATDGSGTTGALVLLISYIDEEFNLQDGVHVLSNTGSDVTTFSGLGINRIVVLTSGTAEANTNSITVTETTGGTTQAIVPALGSVTQQAIFHVPLGFTATNKWLWVNVNKLSGGGTPRVVIKGYSYSRFTETRYEVFRMTIDTGVENTISIEDPCNFVLSGRDVLYFVADTDTTNTVVKVRFSLNLYRNE